MKTITIKNTNGDIIYSTAECETVKDAVELALSQGINIPDIFLYRVNISADLSGVANPALSRYSSTNKPS